jgi:hypothetical protein
MRFPSSSVELRTSALVLLIAAASSPALAQEERPGLSADPPAPASAPARPALERGLVRLPARTTASDRTTSARAVRDAAWRAGGRRLVVSVEERRLWLMDGADMVRTAPVAVGKGTRLEHGGRSWRFVTPSGVRRVQGKATNPVWVPPDWHYAELAADSGWTLAPLARGRATVVPGQGSLVVRGDRVVHLRRDGGEEVIPADEEVLFGRTLYVPPMGTANRRIAGELGAYKLELGDGYMLHGTPHKQSIGQAATHGCIRLGDADIEYLYRAVPVGTPVYIY